MNIGLFTSVFFNNIGNGFIDLGAEVQIKSAMPSNAKLIKLSQCSNFAASLGNMFAIKELPGIEWIWSHILQKYVKGLHDKSYKAVSTLDVFSPAKIALLDYLVIPGCVLTTSFFVIFGKLLEEKVNQGCKLIFLAASGNYYTQAEVKCVSEWLKKLNPYAITFRDSVAYNYYSTLCEKTYNGIDCVWFVNKLDIPKSDTAMDPYSVINFDLPKHKKIRKQLCESFKDSNLIFTEHKPYPYTKVSKLAKRNIMCSDYPLDYLFIYKNVNETYTDRVHACIPTLSFGNKAQLFSDSPRIALFENVGINLEKLKAQPISIDQETLREMQDRQISYLASILK